MSTTADKKASCAAPAPAPAVPAAVEILEEDDEFEEFEGGSWEQPAGATEADEGKLWQDDWDESGAKDDFTEQLRAQVEAATAQQQQQQQS